MLCRHRSAVAELFSVHISTIAPCQLLGRKLTLPQPKSGQEFKVSELFLWRHLKIELSTQFFLV